MTRKRVRMELINHEATRLVTFKKRKASVFKKASELSILCGVPVCVVVSDGSNDATPDVWPQSEEASQIISRFNSLSQSEQTKKMVNKDGFVSQQIAKMQMQLQKINRENQDLESDLLLRNLLSGRCSITDVQDQEMVARLRTMVEMQIGEIQKSQEQLLVAQVPVNGAPESDVGCGNSSMDGIVPVPILCVEPHVVREKNFPPLIDESAEKDEIFDAASLPMWGLVGGEEMPELAETSGGIFKSNGVNVPSLPDWCMVQKDISESLDQSHNKGLIFESSSADVASLPGSSSAAVPLPDWWDEEDMTADVVSLLQSESVNQCEKKDYISESISADVASLHQSGSVYQCEKKDYISESSSAVVSSPDWWDEEGVSADVAPLLTRSDSDEEIMGLLSDQEIMAFFSSI